MNPFDELELDPRLTPKQITERLRIRAERASADEKQRIQTLWRTLTLKETERVRWALFAHPRPASASADAIDALRDKIPPAIIRGLEAELQHTWIDELVPGKRPDPEPPDLW